MRTLLAIPIFNEARYIHRVLGDVRRRVGSILVIDDGSTDLTPELLHREPGIARIRHPENRGYGQSLIDAFAYAIDHEFDWLITMDCDEQHEPSQIAQFIASAREDDADIISGSRYLRPFDGDDPPPPDRRAINAEMTSMLNDLFGLGITDAFCGFKAYRVSALERLSPTIPGYAMPLQLWVQAARAKLRIRELPVRLIYKDPRRHFGGTLDDPAARRRHYLDVLIGELLGEDHWGPSGLGEFDLPSLGSAAATTGDAC